MTDVNYVSARRDLILRNCLANANESHVAFFYKKMGSGDGEKTEYLKIFNVPKQPVLLNVSDKLASDDVAGVR